MGREDSGASAAPPWGLAQEGGHADAVEDQRRRWGARSGVKDMVAGVNLRPVDAAAVERGEQRLEPCGMLIEDRQVRHACVSTPAVQTPRTSFSLTHGRWRALIAQ
jgi:hypothetical protein